MGRPAARAVRESQEKRSLFWNVFREGGGAAPAFLLNKNGGRLTTRSVERLMKKYLALAGLNPIFYPTRFVTVLRRICWMPARICVACRNYWDMPVCPQPRFIRMYRSRN